MSIGPAGVFSRHGKQWASVWGSAPSVRRRISSSDAAQLSPFSRISSIASVLTLPSLGHIPFGSAPNVLRKNSTAREICVPASSRQLMRRLGRSAFGIASRTA